ncbi:hypothetical protein DEO72_LG2g4176 [Vigna unguiculata]|uniref:Uncharacterized protein n=1 Tax=Vigna unguiculata TaxID=3917 RepID=A0A4D6L5Q9_VIGUN|nr:hypothetical protein DEO72_LG2g4176 [Vigna unguiculata]
MLPPRCSNHHRVASGSCTSTAAATTLLQPPSPCLRWFAAPSFPTPPFRAWLFRTPPSPFSDNYRVVIPPR